MRLGDRSSHYQPVAGERGTREGNISAIGKTDIARHIDGVTGDAVSHLERAIDYLYATLDGVHTTIHSYDDLLTLTDELGYKGNPLAPQIREWNLRELLEQHLFLIHSREIRQYFFRVFNLWSSLVLMVEVSTSISTELFYRVEGNGSLTEVPPTGVAEGVVGRRHDGRRRRRAVEDVLAAKAIKK